MPNLYARETYINATKGHGISDGPWYETYTDARGELYRAMRKEYGRCVSKVYVDRPGAEPLAVGWVFQGRQRYEDTNEPYLREVWVEVSEQPQPRR